MKNAVQRFGKFLSGMVMPNIGAFIAWGFITALFISSGWWPNEQLETLNGPMLNYLLPILIAYQGGKMVGGDRGGVMGAIAVIGVIIGAPGTPMLMGAMIMGPLAGFIIKKFDRAMDGHMPTGFEMLINNFSIGIFGMILAILGFYAIGPFMNAILAVLTVGVEFLVNHGILPLLSIFIEPAKVLFLNNAINHGVFTPIGVEQAAAAGKSIMYMLETNPGPGLGVLLAYMAFSKDKVTKSSAPGAVIIHLLGGIHEIYFPYILMNPVVILAPIVGNIAAIFFFSITGAGLTGPPSPGSIIAFMAMTPKGSFLISFLGILIATVVSFLIAAPIVKNAGVKSLDEAQGKVSQMKAQAKGTSLAEAGTAHKVVFACDAGMGSSAMGATKFRNRIKPLGLDVIVTNTSVDNIPSDADIVVCQVVLKERAEKSAPHAQVITINNFLQDPNLDALYELFSKRTSSTPVAQATAETSSTDTIVLTKQGIKTGLASTDKESAIRAAGSLLCELGCVEESYIEAMIERENLVTTYMGLGVAIPHGSAEAKQSVKQSGIVVMQYPDGVAFGDEKAYLIFGIAGVGDTHLKLLERIAQTLEDQALLEDLKQNATTDKILGAFNEA